MAAMAKWRRHSVEALYTWRYPFEGRPEPRHANPGTTPEEGKEKQLRDEITTLKPALADKTLEIGYFRSGLLRIQNGRRQSIATGASASTSEPFRLPAVRPDEAELPQRTALLIVRGEFRTGYSLIASRARLASRYRQNKLWTEPRKGIIVDRKLHLSAESQSRGAPLHIAFA